MRQLVKDIYNTLRKISNRKFSDYIKHDLPDLKTHFLFFYQRKTRGFDDSETWSLQQSLSRVILPRLKRFKEVRVGYPSDLSQEEWDNILEDMVFAFEFFASDDQYTKYPSDGKEYKRALKGIKLFSKRFGNLWW